MHKRFAALVALAALLLGFASPVTAALAGNGDSLNCHCTDGLCRCEEHHGSNPWRRCHKPGEDTGTRFASCDSHDDTAAVTPLPYLLPGAVEIPLLATASDLPIAAAPALPELANNVSPPPPRR